jgi:hypothetical protein
MDRHVKRAGNTVLAVVKRYGFKGFRAHLPEAFFDADMWQDENFQREPQPVLVVECAPGMCDLFDWRSGDIRAREMMMELEKAHLFSELVSQNGKDYAVIRLFIGSDL